MGALLEHVWFWGGVLVTVLNYLIVFVLVPRIVSQRRESGATLAWVFFILLVPYLGLLVFWAIGTTRIKLRRRRRRRARAVIQPRLGPLAGRAASLAPPPGNEELLALASRIDASTPAPGNAVELFGAEPATFAAMEAAIDEARDHVHVLFYIWTPDRTGQQMVDALVRARRRGVDVRLLVDDVGARSAGRRHFRPLVEAGGRVERFLPVHLFTRRLSLNHRNHRKILLADGWVAFTGGMNVADEYAGRGEPWQDVMVRVAGPAVLRLQEIFAQDWFATTGEDLAQPRYFPDPAGTAWPGGEWVQFLASGPDDERWHAIHLLLFTALTQARERVWLETPYFVPDPPLILALQVAALRGVDVRLLVPQEPDHRFVRWASRSFYGELLEAGVKIYELPGKFLHSKTATVDGRFSTVGSANLDRRSFQLNFEANAFFYGPEVARQLERAFRQNLARSVPVDPAGFRRRHATERGLESFMRLLAPVL